MGLSPYGNRKSASFGKYISLIKSELVEVKDDGSVFLNQAYFNYATGSEMTNDAKWEKLFGFARRNPGSLIEQHYCDLALAAQTVAEEIILKMVAEAKRLTGCRNLCMAGGVALNCVANGKLDQSGLFENIFIQPAAGDAGGALGAAYAAHFIYCENSRQNPLPANDTLKGYYLGTIFSDNEIKRTLKVFNARFTYYDSFDTLTELVARLLS